MTYELSAEEKESIINQHLKNLEFKRYNLDLSLMEEQTLSSPSTERLAEINSAISEVVAQKDILMTQLEGLV